MFRKASFITVVLASLFFAQSVLAYNASYVIGQNLFTDSAAGTTSAKFDTPKDIEYDPDDQLLYVMEYNNNRVLVFDVSTITNGEAAIHVLGQDDFTTSASNTALDRLSGPVGLALDSEGDKLFVIDEADRVSIFDVSTITDGEDAVNFLGFWGGGGPTSTSADSSARGLASNFSGTDMGMFYDEDVEYLYVSDVGNNRVLVFDMNSITDGEDAIHVIGQSGYGALNVAPGLMPTGLDSPSFVSFIDSLNYLVVSNSTCVGMFDVSTITDGEAAVRVLGANELACDGSGGATTNQNGFLIGIPYGTANNSEKNILYAADPFKGLMLFDSTEITTGENAFSIIGQTSFDNSDSGTTESLMGAPGAFAIAVDEENNRIFVVDNSNNRILVFEFINITSGGSMAGGTVGSAYNQTITTEKDQGVVEFAVTSGTLPAGLSLASDGTISGTPTSPGDYSFTVRATDVVVDDVQEFSDNASFSISIAAAPSSGGGGGSSGSRIRGCMDPIAMNFNPRAVIDNGSCTYREAPQPTQPSISCPVFKGYAKLWSKDNDKNEVMKIQQFLNDKMGETLKVDGTFGLGTYFAVKRFQEKYYVDIIIPWEPINGLNHTTGWWHRTTSAKANALSGC